MVETTSALSESILHLWGESDYKHVRWLKGNGPARVIEVSCFRIGSSATLACHKASALNREKHVGITRTFWA